MTLYLIAHKVRGEAALDVAERINCPVCYNADDEKQGSGCDACEPDGFWWIIPTSGHRAWPYWHCEIERMLWLNHRAPRPIPVTLPSLPDPWPDHYAVNNPEHKAIAELDASSILSRLGLKRKPVEIKRRF